MCFGFVHMQTNFDIAQTRGTSTARTPCVNDPERLGERALDDVHPVRDTFALGHAAAARAVHPHRVNLLEEGERTEDHQLRLPLGYTCLFSRPRQNRCLSLRVTCHQITTTGRACRATRKGLLTALAVEPCARRLAGCLWLLMLPRKARCFRQQNRRHVPWK